MTQNAALGDAFQASTEASFGSKPCVLVIDFCKAYTQPDSKWYCGDPNCGVVPAVRQSVELIAKARAANVPVIYTTVIFASDGSDDHLQFIRKVPSIKAWTKENPLTEFDPLVAPVEGDVVLNKHCPGAFFGTSLQTVLTSQGIDTCLLIGCSTSGCIRATALEGMQHGFSMVIPRECVGDRTQAVHDSNLFDMSAKVCDVTSKAAVLVYLDSFLKRQSSFSALIDVDDELIREMAEAAVDAVSPEASPKERTTWIAQAKVRIQAKIESRTKVRKLGTKNGN